MPFSNAAFVRRKTSLSPPLPVAVSPVFTAPILASGPLRAEVARPDHEDHRVDEAERVLEHQPLQLAVVDAAPVEAGQERPADLDLGLRLIVAVEARRSDDQAVGAIDDDQRAAGGQRLVEERAEDLDLVAVAGRVLLPDQRVGGDGVERLPVVGAERAQLQALALQHRLGVEGHALLLGDGFPEPGIAPDEAGRVDVEHAA